MRYPAIIFIFMISMLAMICTAQDSSPVQVDRRATEAGKGQRNTLARPARQDRAAAASNNSSTQTIVTAPAAREEASPFLSTETLPVASWDGGQLTNREVSATLNIRRPANIRISSPDQFATMGHAQQVETVKQFAYEQILYQKALDAGVTEENPEVSSAIKLQVDDILNRLYYSTVIEPEMERLTEQAAEAYYHENKNEMFTRPALDVVRALHISTYEMVTAEEGDTLESLAQSITGDADVAQRILSGQAPYYLRGTPTELQDKVLSSPLKSGEVVFVPFGEDRVASATAYAETLRNEILAGETIDFLAATRTDDYVVSATAPLLINTELPYFDALIEAADSLDETSVSEVVKTPAGLNILVVQDRATTQVAPYEQVREYIRQRIQLDGTQQRDTTEKARERTVDQLWQKYNVQINNDALSRPNPGGSDPLSTSTVIAHADDLNYTLAEYMYDLRLTGKDWGQLTNQERLDVLRVAPAIVSYLAVKEARALGLDQTEEFELTMKGITTSEVVAHYLKTQQPARNEVSLEDLRAFYNDNLDNYTSPAQVTIREITKRINLTLPPAQKAEAIEKATESLNEIKSRIKTKDDFIQLARRESQAISTRSRGGLIGTVSEDFRNDAFRNQLRQLEPGQVSEPFMYGSEVVIIRMDDRVAPTVQPFEEVRRQVIQEYARTVPTDRRQQERDQALSDANFKLLF